jgi:hypothetical protein
MLSTLYHIGIRKNSRMICINAFLAHYSALVPIDVNKLTSAVSCMQYSLRTRTHRLHSFLIGRTWLRGSTHPLWWIDQTRAAYLKLGSVFRTEANLCCKSSYPHTVRSYSAYTTCMVASRAKMALAQLYEPCVLVLGRC